MGHALPEEARCPPVQPTGFAQAGVHPQISNRRETEVLKDGDESVLGGQIILEGGVVQLVRVAADGIVAVQVTVRGWRQDAAANVRKAGWLGAWRRFGPLGTRPFCGCTSEASAGGVPCSSSGCRLQLCRPVRPGCDRHAHCASTRRLDTPGAGFVDSLLSVYAAAVFLRP